MCLHSSMSPSCCVAGLVHIRNLHGASVSIEVQILLKWEGGAITPVPSLFVEARSPKAPQE